jgi:hypothetical protein
VGDGVLAAERPVGVRDGGVEQDHVEVRVLAVDEGEQPVRMVGVRDVARVGDGAVETAGLPAQALVVAGDHDRAAAATGELLGGFEAHAGPGPGNQRLVPGEVHALRPRGSPVAAYDKQECCVRGVLRQMSGTTSCRSSWRSRASAWAVGLPMPVAAPVISATDMALFLSVRLLVRAR